MPARILVTSGITAGHRYWIDEAVMRIGSDSACAIILPSVELPPHAATLEFRKGKYYVHNKSSLPQQLNGHPLAPTASAVWQPQQSLQLASDVVLILEIEGDPAPSIESAKPQAHEEDYDPVTAAVSANAASAAPVANKSSAQIMQVAIIGICLLGCGLLLMRNKMPKTKSAKPALSFSQVVEQSQAALPEETRLLQYSKAMLLRNRKKDAREWLYVLRDRLLARQAVLRTQGQPTELPILDYTSEQLGKL